MQALQLSEGKVHWSEVQPLPQPAGNEVTVKVSSVGVNRADLMQIAGKYPPPPGASDIPGLEVSGIVAEVGCSVSSLQKGQRVAALLAGGGFAEYVNVPAEQVLFVPDNWTDEMAAGWLETFATAYLNVFMLANLQPKELVMTHAGASGVGSSLIQLCRESGNPITAVVGSSDKEIFCKELGATDTINRYQQDIIETMKDIGGVDVVLNPVAGDSIGKDQHYLNQDGRIILIGLMGAREGTVDFGRMLMKRQRIIGSTLRSLAPERKGEILTQMWQQFGPQFTSGAIQPVIDKTFEQKDIQQALDYVAANKTQGKVIVKIDG
ncbi:NADPH:quinone reductase [Idiomarina piscisalsi]|uniref:NADPH:quinone reductase n=1 Tax=Idiomarina piscisalsi TaxID=1096243 RepID=A0ABM6LTS0_9GAMM|nr:NAD(P)H-quinone oxidoreductase [Idiomarina piscisalsi]ASG65992.1 NADPH:quinone reductase [Idiomarina piscisalsi]